MKVRILAEAELEASEAARWYEDKKANLGLEFLDAVAQGLEALEKDPSRFTRVPIAPPDRDVRRLLLKRFPYELVFEIRAEEVLVVAVAHSSRRPFYWKRRLDQP